LGGAAHQRKSGGSWAGGGRLHEPPSPRLAMLVPVLLRRFSLQFRDPDRFVEREHFRSAFQI
jgi:hypothetical protein